MRLVSPLSECLMLLSASQGTLSLPHIGQPLYLPRTLQATENTPKSVLLLCICQGPPFFLQPVEKVLIFHGGQNQLEQSRLAISMPICLQC